MTRSHSARRTLVAVAFRFQEANASSLLDNRRTSATLGWVNTSPTTTIHVDADACPVKDEAVRVAERHGLTIHFASTAFMRLPEGPLIERVGRPDGPDAGRR